MVQMPGKLPHFDFAHKKALLEEESPNMPLLQEYVFKQLQESIAKYVSQQQSAYTQVSGTSSEAEPKMVPRAAAAYSALSGQIVQPDFFLDLLRMQSKRRNRSMEEVPLLCRHLIWQVPETFLVRRLRQQRLVDDLIGKEAAAAHPARACSLILQTLGHLQQSLENISPESWTRDNFSLSVEKGTELSLPLRAELEGSVSPETLDKKVNRAFSELLRWALMASDPGPPNNEVMEFLGREESLKRIRTAAEVAQKAAEQPDWQAQGFEWSDLVSESPHANEPGQQPTGTPKARKKPGEGQKARKRAEQGQ